MYTFAAPLSTVRGLGPASIEKLSARQIATVGQLLTVLPLRYEDRSQLYTVAQLAALSDKQTVTVQGSFTTLANQYRGRASTQRATLMDATGRVKLIWFNSPYVITQLKKDQSYMVSGVYDPKFRTISQPVVEKAAAETIHTNRLVPLYSSSLPLSAGAHRRVIKHIIDNLAAVENEPAIGHHLPTLPDALAQLHFPTTQHAVISARERLALEEFLSIMQWSAHLKQAWHDVPSTPLTDQAHWPAVSNLMAKLPFLLTSAQERCIREIFDDLCTPTPMNRLLIGDVGSGKTVVAGCAAWSALTNGHDVALVAPTKILAGQHQQTFAKLFPDVEVQLITGQQTARTSPRTSQTATRGRGTLFIGTHAVLNRITQLNPSLVIYDEQQRFGVMQRSAPHQLDHHPHVLTMTATPIPRSLTLTLFSHLQVSHIDEMPSGRLPVKTWLVPPSKRASSYEWVAQQIDQSQAQVFVVCPFIDPSSSAALENVANVTESFQKIQKAFPRHRVGLLHARLKKQEQATLIQSVYDHHLDILVTTPIVEVGVDLPEAAIMIIENAERFGLSSLHQLRGRVGRAGQQGYCLLFSQSKSSITRERLKLFSNESKGLKIAEIDLENRGSGELFGTSQTGFSELQFGSWTNLDLIKLAQETYAQLPSTWSTPLSHLCRASEGERTPLGN